MGTERLELHLRNSMMQEPIDWQQASSNKTSEVPPMTSLSTMVTQVHPSLAFEHMCIGTHVQPDE
eukprot:755390-Amphidinium_carterae.1